MNAADSNLAKDLHEVAEVYAIDPDLVLRRRFRRLHYFNLYSKQARLVALGQKLANYKTLEETIRSIHLDPTENDAKPTALTRLLKDIDDALKDFDMACLMYQRSLTAPKVPFDLLQKFKKATSEKYSRYFDHYEIQSGWDECAFHTASEKSLLHKMVDNSSCLQSLFVKKRKVDDEEGLDTRENSKALHQKLEKQPIMLSYSEDRVRHVVDIFINLSFCAVVLIPTIGLSYMSSKIHKMILLAVSVLLAAIVSSFLASTIQRPGLAVIAAYTAILVVFLSNNPGI